MKKQQLPLWEVGGRSGGRHEQMTIVRMMVRVMVMVMVSELATGHPGNQDSGNIYYRSHIIQYMLILSPNSRYKKEDKRY